MPKLDDYEKDVARLTAIGRVLYYALYHEHGTDHDKASIPAELEKLPHFSIAYQPWYSEALSLLSQVLPERVEDFKAFYSSKTVRKEITFANYTISDCLKGLVGRLRGETLYSPRSAANAMFQQFSIIQGLERRFKSTLFDIKTLVHADMLDDELHAAEELNKNGFQRGAGAIAGVVLEGHLGAVCDRHQIKLSKSKPTISTFNDALKDASVIDVAQWRFIQHLGDLRNKCDHKLSADPSKAEVQELIDGVRKITKTVL